MLEKKEFEIPSEKFKKEQPLYTDSDTPVKSCYHLFSRRRSFYMEEEKIFHALT